MLTNVKLVEGNFEDRHSVSGTGEGDWQPRTPLPAGQNMAALQVSSIKMFRSKGRYLFIHSDCSLNLKQKKDLICFNSRCFSCWHIMSGFLVVSIPSRFDTSRFGTNWSRFDMTSLGLQPKPWKIPGPKFNLWKILGRGWALNRSLGRGVP